NGEWLVTGGDDQTIRLWEIATGREIQKLAGHSDMVTSVGFSPDGKQLASASKDRTVNIWDLATGAVRHRLDHPQPVWCVAYSRDGHWLASSTGECGQADLQRSGLVKIWDAAHGVERSTLTGHNGMVSAVAFGPDERTLATADATYIVKVWELGACKLI